MLIFINQINTVLLFRINTARIMSITAMFGRDLIKIIVGSFRFILVSISLLLLIQMRALSLQNSIGAHDPSSIIKCGNTYWIFTTGEGIYSMYSTDLISWSSGATPFPANDWPSWINDYVSDFAGNFWAPECRYMNGKYYLYYACSSWGVKTSVIGLVTNKTLNPGSPDYEWIDEGMVVYSDASSDANCIDPSLFQDKEGKLWLTYGSYFGGIRMAELNTETGKPKNSTRYAVASGDCEASYVISHGDYYYLFINRGTCCQGVNSTYHIQVGRSQNPNGPFLDMGNHNMNAGYGSTILATSGSFIGPGCLGYFVENGTELATFHYYNGDNGGSPTLAIASIRWDENYWPVITFEWLDDGIYSIANQYNYFVWESTDCLGAENEAIVQGIYTYKPCQQWRLSNLGNGYYSILSSQSDFGVELSNCASSTGTPLILGQYSGESCEIWRIERTNAGTYTLASKMGNRVATLSEENNDEGIPIKLASYIGTNTQKWILSDTSISITPVQVTSATKISLQIYPNPSTGNQFNIITGETQSNKLVEMMILSIDGSIVYQFKIYPETETPIDVHLYPGVYSICIKGSLLRKKVVIL
jgi:arabinan endo-1,5-alpha-L-arabinosidase